MKAPMRKHSKGENINPYCALVLKPLSQFCGTDCCFYFVLYVDLLNNFQMKGGFGKCARHTVKILKHSDIGLNHRLVTTQWLQTSQQ